MPGRGLHRLLGALVLLLGAAVLLAALIQPWYTYSNTIVGGPAGAGGTRGYTFYLGASGSNGTVHLTISGPQFSSSSQESYDNAGLSQTGLVAEITFGLVAAGCAFGLAAGALGLASRGRARWTTPILVLAFLSLALAIAAPEVFAQALPWGFSRDVPASQRTGLPDGPWSSFNGSSHLTSGTVGSILTWGPSTGWYLSIVAFAIVAVGTVVLFLYRRDPPEPAPAPAPSGFSSQA